MPSFGTNKFCGVVTFDRYQRDDIARLRAIRRIAVESITTESRPPSP